MSKNSAAPIWSLGSKYTRVSIIQEVLPSSHYRRSCADRSSKYLSSGSKRTCAPFPHDKFSARRLPALPELCQKYFQVPKSLKQEKETDETNVRCRLPVMRHRAKKQRSEREVGGGSITYEDDWTYAKLSSSQGSSDNRSGAPILRHYWNISGQDRQRIIACPQHNLIMNEEPTKAIDSRFWRVPAKYRSTFTSDSSNEMIAATQRLIRTAESLQGSTSKLLPEKEYETDSKLERTNTFA